MKNMKKLAFLLIAALGVTSCDMFDIGVDTAISGVLEIDVDDPMAKAAVESVEFTASKIFSMEDDEVQDYADKIDEVGINNVTAEVIAVSGNTENLVIYKGTVFSAYNDDNLGTYTLPVDWEIVKGNTFSLENQGDFYSEIGAILKTVEGDFTVQISGNISENGAKVDLEITIDATYSGSILF